MLLGILRWHDIHTKCSKDWLRCLKVLEGGGVYIYRQRERGGEIHTEQGDLISVPLFFFQNKENRLK
jgi:hypothetical protein